ESPAAGSRPQKWRQKGKTSARRRDRAAHPFTDAASRFYASDRSVSPKPRQRVQRNLAGAPAGVS
ncbi:TPA_asm: hypothetical protein GNB58_004983, partial [Salmonella enterica subsp. houtenae serovar 45:g,z51:-]|nr:hypothetical protein [Salmonella enterica subsp. houtenae serovar 45:g,z51:-]